MIKALYPGTFDPITSGHMDIILRSSKIFDEVIIAVMKNPRKVSTFTEQERLNMINKCIAGLENVHAIIGDGLTVELAAKKDCKVLIRGIRAIADYEYELAQAIGNMQLSAKIETFFLVAKPECSFLSSSIAKEIASLGGDISNMIPEAIKEDVIAKLKKAA